MNITLLQAEGAQECLTRNIPFVIYALPGQKEYRFMASLPDDMGQSHVGLDGDGDCFFISRYASDEPYLAGVNAVMDEASLIDYISSHPSVHYDPCPELPYLTSTRKISYDEAFRLMTRRLKKDGGKVVLSRHEALFTRNNAIDIASAYFKALPDTFRYLCFTPENGLWLGATPELLAEAIPGSGEIRTMALAGTLPSDSIRIWDDKNRLEHDTVVNFITELLSMHGLEVSTGTLDEIITGPVAHLCTHITARGDIHSIGAIINDLNPTPAVAGWPRPLAIAEIDAYETHQRRCYSGIVGVRTGDTLHVYVNLRCAFLAPASLHGHNGYVFNVYAGGGLMPSSQLTDEWEETSRKMSTMLQCIDEFSPNPIEAKF